MEQQRILITGGSGCIGHYLAESLIQETNHELYFLVRNPAKLKFNYQSRPGVKILEADLREVGQFADLLPTINTAILAATAWGGERESQEINIHKNLELINLLNPEQCQQIIYFSTASILDRNNKLLPEAGSIGTDYISTKYQAYLQLSQSAIAPKITTVFPTLVVGGDKDKPYSHISAGLPDTIKWIKLVKWFKADGSFHFIHGRDIAQIITYLVNHPPGEFHQFVLGNACLTANQAVEEICEYLGEKIYFRIPLSLWLADFFIKIFRIRMAAWDRFCLDYRHFTYQKTFTPADFGLPNYCPDLKAVLRLAGIVRRNRE